MNMISRRTAALAVGITAAILGTSTVAQADNSNAGHRSRATIAGIACPTVPDTSATGFSDLCTAVGVAGLGNALGAKQKRFTVFAPTDDAFKKLDPEVLKALLDNKDLLVRVLRHHIVDGAINAENLTEGNIAARDGTTILIATTTDIIRRPKS